MNQLHLGDGSIVALFPTIETGLWPPMTFIFLNEGCNRQPVIFSTTIGKWLKVSIQYYPPSYERMDKYKLIAHLVQLARYAGTMPHFSREMVRKLDTHMSFQPYLVWAPNIWVYLAGRPFAFTIIYHDLPGIYHPFTIMGIDGQPANQTDLIDDQWVYKLTNRCMST